MFKKFLDLGHQPLANSFIKKKNFHKKEKKYKLKVGFNKKNFLVSIINKVPKKLMFNEEYPYRSSQSNTMKAEFKKLSNKIKKKFSPKLIIEIGSNDGAFIKHFSKKKVIGIEPCANLAKITRNLKYKTLQSYWNTQLASKIAKKKKADIIYSANTLSHIENLSEVFKAINIALTDKGILILEDPSLFECLKKNAYDQFYCEHIYVFSSIAIQKFISKHGLEIFDIENLETHGGSNRYYIKKKINKSFKINKNVKKERRKELRYGLDKYVTYKKFARNVVKSKIDLLKILKELKKKKIKVIGYGATAKASTVLNFCNINNKLIEYFMDTTPDKINKYMPGSKIYIKKYNQLDKKKVDVAFLGAWNFKKEIFKKEKRFISKGGIFLTHIPKPRLV